MSRYELLSPEGLRIDGRRWNELRRIYGQMSTQPSANGSSYFEMGFTKVICTVSGPGEPGMRSRVLGDRAYINVEVNYAPFSGIDRKKRAKGDKRVQEMQTALQRTFSECIQTKLLARSEISINLHILSQDGSVLAACINAATLALIDAGIPLLDYMCACTAGSSASFATGEEQADPMLDLNNVEESDLPNLTVATLGASQKIGLLQMETKINVGRLEEMLAVAVDGCASVRGLLNEIVKKHGKAVLQKRSDMR